VKKIYVHIGWHKTGSSSIQEFLLTNKHDLIEREKIYYPSEGMLICAHHPIAWAFQDKKSSPWGIVDIPQEGPEKFIQEIYDAAELAGCNSVVISSEEFCFLNASQIKQFKSALEKYHFDANIVAYIRRQDNLIESAYNMEVKWWGSRLRMSFQEYVNAHTPYISYTQVLKGWADVFGVESLIVRPFSQEKLVGGDARDDFCEILKINLSQLEKSTARINDSLASQSLEFMRLMNSLMMSREENERILSRLIAFEISEALPKCVLFSPEERLAFMGRLDATNKEMHEYSDDVDFLFLNNAVLPEKNHFPLTVAEFNKIYRFVMSSDEENLEATTQVEEQKILSPSMDVIFGSLQKVDWHNASSPEIPEDFDPIAYLLLNPDLISAGVRPYAHYLSAGKNESRRKWKWPNQ
jgi:hypothetical protein